MYFRTAASVALLACATHVAAEPKPYKMAMMPIHGMSLVRRDTNGYEPEQTICGSGDTCAEACGSGYTECPSNDDSIHCYNPEAKQACCADGTGNSCDDGYYCTHDTKGETMCCPDAMDLAECAAAYSVTGGLETPEPTTSVAPSTSSAAAVSTTAFSTTAAETTTPSPTGTPEPSTTATPSSTEEEAFTIKATAEKETSSAVVTASVGYTSAWSGSNTTVAVPTTPAEAPVPVAPTTTGVAVVPTAGSSGANAMGVSALLLAVAGAVALF